MKIALCVIAGDDCFEENIERMFESVKDKVDGVYISFNGTNTDVFERLQKTFSGMFEHGALAHAPWTNDFSVARNHSFKLAAEYSPDSDWLVYLDCDDVVPPETDFREAIEEAEANRAHQVYMRYDYKFDESGEVLWHHTLPRAFRADMNWLWIYPVHENCVGPSGVRSVFSEMSISHFRGDEEPKRERNKQIVAHWYRTDPGDPRAVQMMGHEGFAEAEETRDKKLAKEVINIYREFINLIDTDDDDSYIANIQVGRLFRIADQPSDALNTFLQGIKLRPEWPTAYCEIAETYVIHKHNELAIQWARLARKAGVRGIKTFAPIEEADYEYRPLMIEASALMSEGQFVEAFDIYEQVLALKPDDKIAHSMSEQAIDMQKIKDEETDDPDSMRKELWGAEPDRSIAFLTAHHFENWDGRSLDEKGLGGTETAVIRIAREFRNAGWRVVIFGTPFKEGIDDDGIEWWKTRRWHPDEPFSVFVGVRLPEIFETPMKAEKKFLWLHDVSVGDRRWGVDGQDLFAVPDALMCPSQWHVDHMRALYGIAPDDEEITFAVAPNGVDIERFVKADDDLSERDLGTYIYASSPDRGLERLLHFWPEIFRMTKEAGHEPKLKIYYGWDNIDMIIAAGSPNAPMLKHFKQKIIAMIDQLNEEFGGIEWYGRVNEVTLARSMKCSGFMLYPANFMETFGIVFQQSLIAGCLPITCSLGALPELLPGELVVSGADPDSEIFKDLFLYRLNELLQIEDDWRKDISQYPIAKRKSLNWGEVFDYVWPSIMNDVVVG